MEATANTSPAPDPGSLVELVRRARDGSQEAETALHARYSSHLLESIARTYLPRGHRLCRRFDAADLAQEVWITVFQMIRKGVTFASEGEFVGCLHAVLSNRGRHLIRNNIQRRKRSVYREIPLNPAAYASPAAGKTDPAEIVADKDEWEYLLAGRSERDRQILAAWREDRLEELAAELGLSLRQLYRLLKRLLPGKTG